MAVIMDEADRADMIRVHALLKESSELLGAVFSRHSKTCGAECDEFLSAVWIADGCVGRAALALMPLEAM